MADPNWRNGDYYGQEPPNKGLALARIIGHITYLSEGSMERKFGRKLQENSAFKFDFSPDFQVESYLHYQGKKFVERFDANSYLYITKASDYFDLGEQRGEAGSLVKAFSRTAAKFLVISFSSDWLYPTAQSKDMVTAMKKAGLDVSFCEIQADFGHDSFFLAHEQRTRLVSGFMTRIANGPREPGAGKTMRGRGMRFDLQMIASLVGPRSRVLDLGCGQGDLLSIFRTTRESWEPESKSMSGRSSRASRRGSRLSRAI